MLQLTKELVEKYLPQPVCSQWDMLCAAKEVLTTDNVFDWIKTCPDLSMEERNSLSGLVNAIVKDYTSWQSQDIGYLDTSVVYLNPNVFSKPEYLSFENVEDAKSVAVTYKQDFLFKRKVNWGRFVDTETGIQAQYKNKVLGTFSTKQDAEDAIEQNLAANFPDQFFANTIGPFYRYMLPDNTFINVPVYKVAST